MNADQSHFPFCAGEFEGSSGSSDYRRPPQQENYRRSNSHQPQDTIYKPTPYRPELSDMRSEAGRGPRGGGSRLLPEGLSRHRSLSLNRENSWKKNQRVTPDRSLLSRYINQDLQEMSPPPPPPPPPLTLEERRRGRRPSRFLRPDFYDTPREESAYAKQKEEEERQRSEHRRVSIERRQQVSLPF